MNKMGITRIRCSLASLITYKEGPTLYDNNHYSYHFLLCLRHCLVIPGYSSMPLNCNLLPCGSCCSSILKHSIYSCLSLLEILPSSSHAIISVELRLRCIAALHRVPLCDNDIFPGPSDTDPDGEKVCISRI